MSAKKSAVPDRNDDGKFEHGCGETFTHAAWYAKHALKCDGKKPQTRGRIDRLAGLRSRAATGSDGQHTPAPKPERRRAVHKAPAAPAAKAREARKRVDASIAHGKSLALLEIPSCTRCSHAPVCILRARIEERLDNEFRAEVPEIRLDVGCSLYVAEAS